MARKLHQLLYMGVAGLLLAACSNEADQSQAADVPTAQAPAEETVVATDTQCENYAATGQALFGDLHVHTSFSFDAAANSTGATPSDAYRYARGGEIPFFPLDDEGKPVGRAKIDVPLDFLGVTDHGEFLGERALCRTAGSPVYETPFCENYRANERQGMMMLGTVITTETPARIPEVCGDDGERCLEYAKNPWQKIQQAANDAYEPCAFTSFVGYEYTGTPGTSNYHRNVIFRSDQVPDRPVSYIDAPIDSKLWAGLDEACRIEDGCDYLTIPHNSNLSNGRMAPYRQLELTTANKQGYASKRLQREPIMEIFQHKGGSECINGLSSILGAPDELCDIEAVRHMGEDKQYATRDLVDGELVLGTTSEVTRECDPQEKGANGMLGAGCVHPTDFQRSALLIGLQEEQKIGLNPIKLGIIASTDTHSANPGGVAEDNWGGAVTGEATPEQRLEPGLLTSGIDGNPGGLAGVWARENTRDAIFDAMLRREVFGTSGPRITPRLFAGWDFNADLCDSADRIETGYAQGVPMGGDLSADAASNETKPKFLALAAKDPRGRDLQTLQLIKGWVAQDGALHTEVIPVAESATGAATLCTVYEDQAFDPALSAYYYLRVVEPETPRWHTYDCARIAEDERPAVCSDGRYPETIREMAWTSPIWFRPAAGADS
ncbi:MAG: DUF3604 domain-containing protein [Pseudomonadales bacterium]